MVSMSNCRLYWIQLIFALLLSSALSLPSVVPTIQRGSCCLSWTSSQNPCTTCHSWGSIPRAVCTRSKHNAWCPSARFSLRGLQLPQTERDMTSNCCFYAPTSDKCGTCTGAAAAADWCAVSAANCVSCAGTWCGRTQVTTAPPQRVQSICCFWAPTADKCGTCGAQAASTDWCAVSAANCAACTGTWCQGSSTTVALTTASATTVAPALTTATTRSAITTTQSKTMITSTQSTTSTTTTSTTTPTTLPPVTTALTTPPLLTSTAGNWVDGTYITGYWDCCKPSCSWPGKGSVTSPVKSCKPDGTAAGPNDLSVCDGGVAASCTSNQPWVYSNAISIGFAAAAVSGASGLTGDANCGQCYELKFTNQIHGDGNWGGSHPLLVGKSHIVQVTNIGNDVTGSQSFDLQIPGAGQGIFTSGCTKQFGGQAGDYDCDNRYGGCDAIAGCARLPVVLRPGCEWRYTWFKWLVANGQTNNPYVRFRRVRCPQPLTAITGSIPLDDANYPVVL
jgi:hypothetical protein